MTAALQSEMSANSVLIIGGGPAGLRAAEVARRPALASSSATRNASVGRKFLVAGRGGLNLTHGEPVENFPARYVDEPERWRDLLGEFGPDELRAWAAELGVETYVGTSGRVFPRGQKAAGLLRAWVRRLRSSGVQFRTGARLVGVDRAPDGWRADFQTVEQSFSLTADAIVLALGGASWPETGSDGTWPAILAAHGVEITPWHPANCGWEVDWPPELLARAEGLPLKNLTVRAGDESVSGELLITRHGLEGGAIYRLGRTLRSMAEPCLEIDFKPQLTTEVMRERAGFSARPERLVSRLETQCRRCCLARDHLAQRSPRSRATIARVKNFILPLARPASDRRGDFLRGGVRWSELDEELMLRKLPGIFVAGEMIDWEAPTGGYLLQGCFATGTRGRKARLVKVANAGARKSCAEAVSRELGEIRSRRVSQPALAISALSYRGRPARLRSAYESPLSALIPLQKQAVASVRDRYRALRSGPSNNLDALGEPVEPTGQRLGSDPRGTSKILQPRSARAVAN